VVLRKTQPVLTLAVPYYSRFPLLLAALRSIRDQAFDGCAVLLMDDSPAGLSELELSRVQELMAQRFPLRVVRSRGAEGMASAWAQCIRLAATDLVTLVHSDDELEPGYAGEMTAFADAHPDASAVFCGARIIGAHGRPVFSFADTYKRWIAPRPGVQGALELCGEDGVEALLRGNFIFCPTLCYRKSRLPQRLFDPTYKMVLDMEFVIRMLMVGHSVVGLPDRLLYAYRRHDDNATAQLTRDHGRFVEECDFYSKLGGECRRHGYLRASRVAEQKRIIKLNVLYCAIRDGSRMDFNAMWAKLRLYRELFIAPLSVAE
jgi:Glycosyl transferase family 2